ncbi:MAG: branched-chain amino acid ABC transporter substrate-binding protein [Candidatus Rokuibacteriota bacterium]|nr:MAG: branched-chain amino acid ABC transporter substrate-binding protein [Candidatus Rokubacteria bacterium]
MRKLSIALGLLLTSAGVALAAGAGTPGVSSNEIVIGGTAPLTGEASSAAAVSQGASAYLDFVDAHGGVNGRKITYQIEDDAYDPPRTVLAVRKLVEQDHVFAIFNTLGTNNNLAVRDYLNASKVPQLFVASGANTWGADYKQYPWTIGYIPSYVLEGQVYAHYVLKNRPRAKIGVLYQDDDYGHDLLAGLRLGLGKKASLIKAQVGYDPKSTDVSSEVQQLKSSGADVFMVFAFGKFSVQAMIQASKLGWRPKLVVVNAVSSSANLMTLADLTGAKAITKGAVTVVFFKDPTDPKWKKDAGLALERTILKKYGPAGANAKDGYYVAGMASAYTLVDALKRAGKSPTQASVMKAARSLDEPKNPFVLPGILIKTSATDGFPMQQVALERWTKGHWSVFTGLLTAKS